MAGSIVVGFDASEVAARALERAIVEAKATGGELTIVVVEEMPYEPNAAPMFTLGPPPVVAPVAERLPEPPDVRALADQAVARARAEGVAADVVWDAGDPMRVIVDAARDHHAAAIVVGAHHYNLLQRALGEDVVAAVRRRVDCDVIAVP